VAGTGAAMGLGGLALHNHLPGRAEPTGPPSDALIAKGLRPARRSSRAFGTTVSIEAWHTDERVASEAVSSAFGELALIEELRSSVLRARWIGDRSSSPGAVSACAAKTRKSRLMASLKDVHSLRRVLQGFPV
jgi:hypothetical protein